MVIYARWKEMADADYPATRPESRGRSTSNDEPSKGKRPASDEAKQNTKRVYSSPSNVILEAKKEVGEPSSRSPPFKLQRSPRAASQSGHSSLKKSHMSLSFTTKNVNTNSAEVILVSSVVLSPTPLMTKEKINNDDLLTDGNNPIGKTEHITSIKNFSTGNTVTFTDAELANFKKEAKINEEYSQVKVIAKPPVNPGKGMPTTPLRGVNSRKMNSLTMMSPRKFPKVNKAKGKRSKTGGEDSKKNF